MIPFETLLKTLKIQDWSLWNPLIWGIVIVITYLIIYIIRGFGKKGFKEKTEQAKVFLSGNPELEKEKMHVGGSNVYWGFLESLKWLYSSLEKMHTGNTSDYILWFVIILGVMFLIVGVI